MNIEQVRNKRTKIATDFMNSLYHSCDPTGASFKNHPVIRNIMAYLMSEYDVRDNITNLGYLHKQRAAILPELKYLNDVLGNLIDTKESEKQCSIVIDEREFNRCGAEITDKLMPLMENYNISYMYTKEFFNITSTVHVLSKHISDAYYEIASLARAARKSN